MWQKKRNFVVETKRVIRNMLNVKDYLLRWRHRHGFGIHSPWAYELVTDVLCAKSHYYCFKEMEGTESDRQLYRLFVHLKPKHYIACGGTETARAHMKAAFDSNTDRSDTEVYYFAADRAWEVEKAFKGGWIDQNSCLILEGIDREPARALWQTLLATRSVTSTFESRHRGIAFYDPARQKLNYLI